MSSASSSSPTSYALTNNWFDQNGRGFWDQLIPGLSPRKILEVGSYEGASSVYLIDKLSASGPIELHCVDSWQGGVEHAQGGSFETDMGAVETRFHSNIAMSVAAAAYKPKIVIHKGLSDAMLCRLIAQDAAESFDFIFIDGSHQAPDVLSDAVLGFKLLKVGGVMVFDDYIWSEHVGPSKDLLRCPKPAIDAFTNLYARRLDVMPAPLYQLYIRKTAA